MKGYNLPKKIIIKDGQLIMEDGSNLQEYLKGWQEKNKVKDGSFVSIFQRDDLLAWVNTLEEKYKLTNPTSSEHWSVADCPQGFSESRWLIK